MPWSSESSITKAPLPVERVYLFEQWRDLPQLFLQRIDPFALHQIFILKAARLLGYRGDLTIPLRNL